MNTNKVIQLFDCRITPVLINELIQKIDDQITDSSGQKVIGYTNMHGIYMSFFDKEMQKFYRDVVDVNYIDGMPIVWLVKLLGHKINRSYRMTFLDFIDSFFKHCESNNYKILWIGGHPTASTKGIANLKGKFPNLNLVGIDGYQNDNYYQKAIAEYKPDILLLGLGMPRQEKWVNLNKNQIQCSVIWCIGATIDYLAGNVYLPPRWSGRMGLEWFFRLVSEPKRMWFRYFIEPLVVLYFFSSYCLKRSLPFAKKVS